MSTSLMILPHGPGRFSGGSRGALPCENIGDDDAGADDTHIRLMLADADMRRFRQLVRQEFAAAPSLPEISGADVAVI